MGSPCHTPAWNPSSYPSAEGQTLPNIDPPTHVWEGLERLPLPYLCCCLSLSSILQALPKALCRHLPLLDLWTGKAPDTGPNEKHQV